jgi:tetratricopeptide (TPR) repeat protein
VSAYTVLKQPKAYVNRYLHERGGGKRFYQFLDAAEAICQAWGNTYESMEVLSDVHYARGAEAAKTDQKSASVVSNFAFLQFRLHISEISTQGTQDEKLAQALNQAANACLEQSEYAKAIELYHKSIEIVQSLNNYTKVMTTGTVANLGTAYWLSGKYDEASEVLLDNLLAREETYGVNDTHDLRHVRWNFSISQLSLC